MPNFRSANLNQMVSSIIDENSEYQQNGIFNQWINGGQIDQHMHYVQQMNNSIPSRQVPFSESGQPRNIPGKISLF